MHHDSPHPGLWFLMLSAAMAASALLGPLGIGMVEFRVSDAMENQLVGGELIALVLVAPLALAAGILFLRRHRLAPVLAIAPALFAVYTYPQYIIGPDYVRYPGNNEHFIPFYMALVILGWVLALWSWRLMKEAHLPSPSRALRRSIVALLCVIGMLVTAAWASDIVDALGGGMPSREYRSDPTLFWLIRLLDLGFVVPMAIITAVGLVRRADWSRRLVYAVTGFLTILVASVAAMAMVMAVRGDPAASLGMVAATGAVTIALTICYAALIRRMGHEVTVHQRPSGWQIVMRPPRGSRSRHGERLERIRG